MSIHYKWKKSFWTIENTNKKRNIKYLVQKSCNGCKTLLVLEFDTLILATETIMNDIKIEKDSLDNQFFMKWQQHQLKIKMIDFKCDKQAEGKNESKSKIF